MAPERTKPLYITSVSRWSSPVRLLYSWSYTYLMRSKSFWLKDISLSKSVSKGVTFFSVSAMTGVLWALQSPKKTLLTFSSSTPLFS